MAARILLAGLFHETHCFVEKVTLRDDCRFRRGPEMLARAGDGSTIDGFLQVARREGWDVVPTIEMGATPSGPIDDAVFEDWWSEFAAMARGAAAAGLDGVWLSLHGAMVTTRNLDPEGDVLRRLRALPGFAELPVFGVFDLHATFTGLMAAHADGLVSYRNNPHTDACAAAAFSAELLKRALDGGSRPRMRNLQLGMILPPTGTGTADSPMRELNAAARTIERDDPEIWAVNVVAGYAFADTPDAGTSLSLITTGSEERAKAHLRKLAEIASARREDGVPKEWRLDAAIDDALARNVEGPVVVVEPADNIGGGAPGDCTGVLRAFLRRGLEKTCVVIADPEAVTALAHARPGGRHRLSLGGKGSKLDPGPVDIDAIFVSRSDGNFTLEDRHSHMAANGVHVRMGPCAVVTSGGATILITSKKTAPFDLGQLRSQGIEPTAMRFIGVKAAVAHRQAYDPIAAASYTVDTPGPCRSDLTTLPYRHLRRPIFPLDPPWRPK
jgi:microcystin degradation protein MlrC